MISKMALEFARTFKFKIGYSATSRTQLGQNFVKNKAPKVSKTTEPFSAVLRTTLTLMDVKTTVSNPFTVVNQRPRGELFPYKSKISSWIDGGSVLEQLARMLELTVENKCGVYVCMYIESVELDDKRDRARERRYIGWGFFGGRGGAYI
jgi:hypothetical protein